MQLLLKRLLFFLPLMFLAFSCTVTKRVHRPGFHIEWKKNYKKQSNSREHLSFIEKDDFNTPIEEGYEVSGSTASNVQLEEPTEPQAEVTTSESFDNEMVIETVEVENVLPTPNSEKHSSFKQMSKLKKQRPFLWRLSGKDLKILGAALMLIGGLLLLASLLSFAGVFSGNGTGNSDAGYYFFDALWSFLGTSSWLWILIAIIIVILIIYLFVLLVEFALGGPFWGAIIGLIMLASGFGIYLWGQNRERIEG